MMNFNSLPAVIRPECARLASNILAAERRLQAARQRAASAHLEHVATRERHGEGSHESWAALGRSQNAGYWYDTARKDLDTKRFLLWDFIDNHTN